MTTEAIEVAIQFSWLTKLAGIVVEEAAANALQTSAASSAKESQHRKDKIILSLRFSPLVGKTSRSRRHHRPPSSLQKNTGQEGGRRWQTISRAAGTTWSTVENLHRYPFLFTATVGQKGQQVSKLAKPKSKQARTLLAPSLQEPSLSIDFLYSMRTKVPEICEFLCFF
jgi:hypothetical protein